MHRLFVAIDLPPLVKRELTEICSSLPGARWVKAEQIHLTLRFIGEVDDGIFQDIRKELADIKSSAFTMRLAGLGFFPPRRPPHVLWAGVEPVESIVVLRDWVEAALVGLGLEPEGRKFSPHVTLARLRDISVARVEHYLAANMSFVSSEFQVSAFHLYSSVLTSNGAIHQVETSYPLDKSGLLRSPL
ncbi:MAG: RNA 2',3'-cyclic phosphodiesterase [Desulfocapsaceae bacterium]|nr:RNA 2',3'-cyclic phosphodiesterase [Desulfocapsaceae bacterium]